MKNTHTFVLKIVFAALLSLNTIAAFSQDEKQKQQIANSYDQTKIETLKQAFETGFRREKAAALAAAKQNNWPVFRRNADGTYDELMALTQDGKPVYYSLQNVNAAKSTRANTLNSGGILGLSLDGQGMFSGVWDGGAVRTSHQEFGGRMMVSDGVTALTDNSFHATHVSGTVGATGVSPNAKGMAPLSTVKTFDWNNDLAEALQEARNGLLLSNHSYGIPLDNMAGNWFAGAYSGDAVSWDQLARSVPYYLMVASAGNDGNETNPAPLTTGYDKLTGNKCAKNNLVVANAQDANVDAQGNLVSVSINSSSSEGPTDDRRVKPDISGNGSGLYSSSDSSDTSYATLTGTSMSSPNVMGTLVLVQQHYNNVNNHFMKAATLKGLACHTADDKGKIGPDPVWGWGLLNAKKAAQAITNNGLQSWISEETLQQGGAFTFTAESDGTTPLLASICWTDVPGAWVNGALNSTTPALVNDLDIRISKDGTTYFPWKLQQAANLAAIRSEDNAVDNVERISIDAPSAGTYTITVTHKGTLQDGPQPYAFIVTGIASNFGIVPTSGEQTVCVDGSAEYTFHLNTSNTTPVNFTASGLPNGAVATFSTPSLSTSGNFSVTISNLQNAVSGFYPVSIIANNGIETETRIVALRISSTDFANVALTAPANNETGVSPDVHLIWNPLENADAFHVQVATDSGFSNIITDAVSDFPDYTVSGLTEATDYYWRVFPKNNCAEGTTADVFQFQTGQLVCDYHFEPENYVNAEISPDFAPASAIMQIIVPAGINVGDLNVTLNITHSNIGDLKVILEGPYALNFPRIMLFSQACSGQQNIDCIVDDSGADLNCNTSAPTISGTVKPLELLSAFNNKPAEGVWTVYVNDDVAGNGGAVNFVSLDFCAVQPLLAVSENNKATFSVFPNPSKGILNVQLSENPLDAIIILTDIQGRIILSQRMVSMNETLHIDHLQNGVYFVAINNGKQKTVKKIVLSK